MQQSSLLYPALRFATFLSPVLYETYEQIATYVGEQIGCPSSLRTGASLEEFADGTADIGFLCGLQYVHMKNQHACPVELLVAPVLTGKRYQHKPIYYSDIIVHQNSPYMNFEELQGCTWAYNERTSHSGYNLVHYNLLERYHTFHYFEKTLATGSHLQSLQAVLDGRADASAIDSHLLDVLLQQKPEIASTIRIIDSFGPSTVPPLVVKSALSDDRKQQVRKLFLCMHKNPYIRKLLHKGCIEYFISIDDADYNDIRAMLKRVQQVGC